MAFHLIQSKSQIPYNGLQGAIWCCPLLSLRSQSLPPSFLPAQLWNFLKMPCTLPPKLMFRILFFQISAVLTLFSCIGSNVTLAKTLFQTILYKIGNYKIIPPCTSYPPLPCFILFHCLSTPDTVSIFLLLVYSHMHLVNMKVPLRHLE